MTKRERKYFGAKKGFIGIIPSIERNGKPKIYEQKDFKIPSLDKIIKIFENDNKKTN